MKAQKLVLFLLMSTVVLACAKKEVAIYPPQPSIQKPAVEKEVITEESMVAKAKAALNEQDEESAYKLYEAYLQRFPQGLYVDEVLMQKGAISESTGDLRRALFDYRQLVAQHPRSPWVPDARLKILELLFAQGFYTQVVREADNLLNVTEEPTRRISIYRILGELYLQQSSYLSALRAFAEAFNLAHSEEKEAISLKLEYITERVSIEEIKSAIKDLPHGSTQSDLLYYLGGRLMREEQYSQALETFNQFVEAYPNHPQAPVALETVSDLKNMMVAEDTIGCLLPLSGPYATFGTRALEGVELALHQFTADSRRPPVRIIVKDTGGDVDQAEEAFSMLADAGVTSIIGPMVTAEGIAPKAQALGIPLVSLTQKETITKNGDYVFRNFITPANQTKALVTYCVKKLGIKRFAILYPSDKYGITFMHQFWDQVLAHGGEVAHIEAYDIEQTDFAVAIKKLTSNSSGSKSTKDLSTQNFEAIFIPDGVERTGLLAPQLTYHDIEKVYLLGTNLWFSKQLVDMARQFVQGCIFPVGFYPDAASWRVTGFVEEFSSVFGKKPGFIEAVAYDTAMMLFDVIAREKGVTRDHMRDQLLKMNNFPGVTGNTSFTPDGDVEKQMLLLTIKGNQFVELSP